MGNLDGNITAPYNFAPLSPHVFLPSWSDQVSIDVPMAGGLSGTLDFIVTAHSPLLVGEKKSESGPVEPFRFPNGDYGIPGSSLRGMIRNVLEIASFGKMSLVDDKRYGVRDLTPGARQFYGNRMTETAGRMKFKPKSKAGWLQFSDGEWKLLPCEFSRVEHHDIKHYLGGKLFPKSNKDRPDAMAKYRFWQDAGKSLSVLFDAGDAMFQPHKGKELFYRKVKALGSGFKQGEVVFTGQPGPSKHLEFIFHDTASSAVEIPERVIQGFLQIYKDTDHWKALQSIDFPNGIPVFYLEKNGAIESLGLSLMYKLAYTNSIGEVVERVQGTFDANQPDLAELIFGYVDEDGGLNSLKGRVSFGHAVCQQESSSLNVGDYQTILNGPKPTYYPNYVVQQQKNGYLENQKQGYTTLMEPNAEIRGWKRYPVRPSFKVAALSRDQQSNKAIQVRLKPLMPDSALSFRSKLRFHNLSKCELGAIVWAMGWGDNPRLRHAIGMGKSFGFGQVSVALDSEKQYVEPNDFGDAPAMSECVQAFESEMEGFCQNKVSGGWKGSEQLIQLLGMADPEKAPGLPGDLSHLDLNGGGRNNEFVLAKKDNKVLEPYIKTDLPQSAVGASGQEAMPWDNSDAGKWLCETVTRISEDTNTPQKNVLHAKGLAERWNEIDDEDVKREALALIKAYWQSEDWWDEPYGKSAVKAYRIYSS